jgi:SAM-dependent methyltransferase
MNQDQVFECSEGDRWFERNRATLQGDDWIARDPILRLIDLTGIRPARVMEVGASNGYRLAEIRRRLQCDVTAVEPSQAAIDDGTKRFGDVAFVRGTASAIAIPGDQLFDLVIVHFVFHWIDRATLLRSAAEIDRLLKDGGHLAIGDFLPSAPTRVEYHHLRGLGVCTYKQDYAELFVASELYERVASFVFDHATHAIRTDVPFGERAGVTLLRKSLQARYAER